MEKNMEFVNFILGTPIVSMACMRGGQVNILFIVTRPSLMFLTECLSLECGREELW